jgi:hypothetical protein
MPTQSQFNDVYVAPQDTGVASELRFYEPIAGGTNYTAFKAQQQAANITYTLPAADGTSGQVLSTNGSGGLSFATPRVLQIVNASTTTAVGVVTNVYTDTTLTATITPTSATSKILILVMQACRYARTANTQGIGIRILRDATVIYEPATDANGPFISYAALANVTSIDIRGNIQINYVDSPATTSAVTYKTQGRPYLTTSSGTCTFQINSVTNQQSTIILMEVAP